jgi:hypothetical protein
MAASKSTKLSKQQIDDLLQTLQTRFEENMHRHKGVKWIDVHTKITQSPQHLISLYEMEQTGGEPDVISNDSKSKNYVFYDCSPESPKGRRSLCYDRKALDGRKENKPTNSIIDLAKSMGIEVLNEEQYRFLQQFGPFDTKTSSWLVTPDSVRNLGGALFGDYRYGQVFIYHNGAESYYAARGYRGMLLI